MCGKGEVTSTGAEIVNGKPDSKRFELQHPLDHGLGLLDEDALGDLQHQEFGLETRFPQSRRNVLHEPRRLGNA